ncbi:MAG: hypothetical protein E7Z90_05090 [Cyanobacteria bacterium SIG29]|nr:hypothetical protein [Cyanobacteria bacterium SIG29]
MKISSINYSMALNNTNSSFKAKKTSSRPVANGMNGEKLVLSGNASKYFELSNNVSNKKVGSKFILKPKMPQYRDLNILITLDSVIEGDDFKVHVSKPKNPSFSGRLYGSIRELDGKRDYKMEGEYIRFWTDGMHKHVEQNYADKVYAPELKDDYNFYIPSDGDGTRYKDITTLQGSVTKPASDIPAYMNGKQMSLVQSVITNFTKTGKLDKMLDFVRVEPAKGSAYGFLEGLRQGKIHTNKPLVFSWGDNFSDINISRLMKNHEDSNSGFTVTVLPIDKARTKTLSIVKTDNVNTRKIDKFVEKPQDDDFIESCVLPQFGENMCLSAVGPYILSSQALEWIKENYTADPESFLNPDKGYDFSSMIVAPMLEAFNNGEILDKNGKPMQMKFDIISDTETWSDLGSQKDFTKAMKDIRDAKYLYLPWEMKSSLADNIDDTDNITFNAKSNELLHKMLGELNAEASNIVAYCKE